VNIRFNTGIVMIESIRKEVERRERLDGMGSDLHICGRVIFTRLGP